MSNTVIIPEKLNKQLKKIARDFGISIEDLLVNAILYYLKNLREKLELKKELEIWERVSDLDLLEFERKI